MSMSGNGAMNIFDIAGRAMSAQLVRLEILILLAQYLQCRSRRTPPIARRSRFGVRISGLA